MKLRKTNAVVSLISTFYILCHAISLAAWMLSRGNIQKAPRLMAWVLTAVVVLHAVLSMIIMVTSHKGNKGHKGKQYPKLNVPTIVQRISGILLILFSWLHIAGTIGIMTPPLIVHAIVPPLFFALVMAHVAISTSKALITLGIGNAKFIKSADIIMKMACVATWIADVIGFYLHVC